MSLSHQHSGDHQLVTYTPYLPTHPHQNEIAHLVRGAHRAEDEYDYSG